MRIHKAFAFSDVRRALIFGLVLTALICLGAAPAHARAGDLDPTFGTAGISLPAITGASYISVRSLAVQSDGRIVGLAQYIHSGSGDQDFMLFRLWPDGSLDTSFSTDGWVTTDFGGCDWPQDLVIQPDGKIVAVGVMEPSCGYDGDYQGVLARYTTGGDLDSSFSGDGKYVMSDAYESFWYGVALQSDNKIVVSGFVNTGANDLFCVGRFTTTGILDNDFDTDGLRYLAMGNKSHATDLAIDGGGNIVAVGYTDYSVANPDVTAVRMDSFGVLDSTFNAVGIFTADLSGDSSDFIKAVAIDGIGRIYLGGDAINGGFGTTSKAGVVVRLTSGGILDSTFSSDGKTSYQVVDHHMNATGMVMDAEGMPVLAGYFGASGSTYSDDSWLIRFTGVGEIDRGFGDNGLAVVSNGSNYDLFSGVVSDDQGRLLCGGNTGGDPIVSRHLDNDRTDRWGSSWWWSDPERNDSYAPGANYVTVRSTPNQDLWACIRQEAPIFYRNLPAGEHWYVKARINVPTLNEDTMAGLMIWNGAEAGSSVYHLSIGLANFSVGVPSVWVNGSYPGMCSYQDSPAAYANPQVNVTIVRNGNDYVFYYSQVGGLLWYLLDTRTTTAPFTKVGVMAKSWGSNSIEAHFSFFLANGYTTSGCLDLLLSP
jgi:uncharacterized delta-60 repeat protein